MEYLSVQNIKNKFFLIIFLTLNVHLFAQKEANIWYFGTRAGVDFNGTTPVALFDGQIDTREGCSSIADENGDLLFYTDGVTVWNKSHNIMSNGTGLSGHISSTQSAIIVKKPLSDSIYYIFTVGQVGAGSLDFSEVNINANGGLGEVILSTRNTSLISPITEKVTAVLHSNRQDIWVITHEMGSDRFFSFLVTSSGVNTTPEISRAGVDIVFGIPFNISAPIGYLKASPNGKHLAIASLGINIELLDFNNSTGEVTNPLVLGTDKSHYGIEFSPSNRFLYVVEEYNFLYQYDLDAADIVNSRVLIDSAEFKQGMQIGPDGKVYIARGNFSGNNMLGVINNPDELGAACNYVHDGLDLGSGRVILGLPQFMQSYFNTLSLSFTFNNTCSGQVTNFVIDSSSLDISLLDSLLWNFGDPNSGALNESTDVNPSHTFSQAGSYNVTLIAYVNGVVDTSVQEVTILQSDDASFSYSQEMYCIEDMNPEPTVIGSTGGTFSSNDSIVIDAISGEIDIISSGEGSYLITYTSNGVCSVSPSTTVSIDSCLEITFTVPNVFSPNSDGQNDFFRVVTNSQDAFKLEIYNRWGQLVFESDKSEPVWDGTLAGKDVPDGTYFYIVTGVNSEGKKEILRGTLSLIR